MQWYNEPVDWQEQDGVISIHTEGHTDFWRVTRHHFIKDNAHFYYQDVQGDFTGIVKVSGTYNALYDQAGMMLRENDQTWMKCGIEFLDGVQQASAVITRAFSDWSIVPLPDNPASTWFQVQRIGSAVEVSYSADGESYSLIRQGYLSEAQTLQFGLMCAAPQAGAGFPVRFEHFSITAL